MLATHQYARRWLPGRSACCCLLETSPRLLLRLFGPPQRLRLLLAEWLCWQRGDNGLCRRRRRKPLCSRAPSTSFHCLRGSPSRLPLRVPRENFLRSAGVSSMFFVSGVFFPVSFPRLPLECRRFSRRSSCARFSRIWRCRFALCSFRPVRRARVLVVVVRAYDAGRVEECERREGRRARLARLVEASPVTK